ncbi:MAG: hypothetical protein ACE5I9_00450 [Candidatus Methylomirabilales bacterium]
MTESRFHPIPSTLTREEVISLARSEKTEPRVLEAMPTQFSDDEELWVLLLDNPQTPLAAVIYMAEHAPASLAGRLLEDRVLLLHNPVVGHALLKNPALTETDRRQLHGILQETTKEEKERKKSLLQVIKEMTIGQKLALAKKGNKEARMILIRDSNEMIALEVVNSPRITDEEILSIAQMRDVADRVLRAIANNRRYRANKLVVLSLLHNPKTPIGVSLGLGVSSLTDKELDGLVKNRNIPSALSRAARQVLDRRRKGPSQTAGH